MRHMVCLTIDGQSLEAKEGMTLLEAARSLNIHIPTLCSHPLLKPLGACRLCIVEVSNGTSSRMVTSCTYPVEEGSEVKTNSPAVLEARKMLVELLLARAPRASVVQRLAEEYGIEKPQLKTRDEGELCILCGLCARLCEEIIGVSAINFIKRGVNREVTFSPEISSELCVGCGVCTAVCPTGCLEIEKPYGVISAIEMGRKAAISMDKYLGGEGIIEEELIEFESPNLWIGMDKGFTDRSRMISSLLLNVVTHEQVVEEAKRCLQCDLRLKISPCMLPPEKWLICNEENVKNVPDIEGVYQLFDSDKNLLLIKGAMNMRMELEEELKNNKKAGFFIYEVEPMYTKKESELLQQYLQQHRRLPSQNIDLDDLLV